MAILRLPLFTEPRLAVKGRRVLLRPPEPRDYAAWAWLREESRDFLSPWEPTWGPDDLSRLAFRRRLKRHREEASRDEAYAFFIHRGEDDRLLGGLTLGQIRRGVSQTGTLGYWMGAPFAGQGYMSDAVKTLTGHAFGPMGLRRIEAACLPHNQRSIRLLEGVGFQREGLARAYLQIDGRWQDHLLYALLSTDVPALRPLPST